MKRFIQNQVQGALTIEKSIFHYLLFPLTGIEDVPMLMQQVKKQFPKANHYCYAYRYQTVQKSSDDGEPAGSAGKPLLQLLSVKEVDESLLIVVRYFGGIKLGSGGLLRAYMEAGQNALEKAVLYRRYQKEVFLIQLPYPLYDRVRYDLEKQNIVILETNFLEEIHLVAVLDSYQQTFYEKMEGKCKLQSLGNKTFQIEEKKNE